MPADSDSGLGDPGRDRVAAPSLPHTWRPFGVRVAVWVFGGLLIAVPRDRAAALVAELTARHTPARAVIGEIVAGEAGHIDVVAG